MPPRLPLLLCVLVVTLAGCPGGDGSLGDACENHDTCSSELQCLSGTCVPRCERAPECGDGFRCDGSGLCQAATGQPGDACSSEVDCVAGLSCQIEGTATGDDGYLVASCVGEGAGRPAGERCSADSDCRNGTCDLGHCIDLCSTNIDCGAGHSCSGIPRVASDARLYRGCLPSAGALSWQIPVRGTHDVVALPIPDSAKGVSVLFTVEDGNQKVGATELISPSNFSLLAEPYFTNMLARHLPDFGLSVLALPSSPSAPLETGRYWVRVRSLRQGVDNQGQPTDINGTATPTMTAVLKLDHHGDASGGILDLHFYFLDLTDHPCASAFSGRLDAETAPDDVNFQTKFLPQLRTIFAQGGVALGSMTYQDLKNHPDLDGLDVINAPSLLALGEHTNGVNVFFVRTLSPVGLQAFGPTPGPAGLAKTRGSGIVIGLDTLCYRSWPELSRIAAHELARYMGLYNNVEVDPENPNVVHIDPILDSDGSSNNLMFYSELGGTELSEGQRYVLRRSPVLR